MTPRALWFVAGTAAGVYASVKARRAAYRISMPGLIDQAGALGSGWRAFSAEMRDGRQAKEHELRTQVLGAPELGASAHAPSHPLEIEKDPT
ncbi:hypothetical protein BHE97_09755 [Aeromicrobium sp. PE09-221]|uniref:DUF6167 family protein n=1 Tax=Aeromicrobium sp. PE09-221 TaxID=1898043 RepID=UPI000B3ED2D5|nr:DUF6167 family protein [Aeromicrobium sp. PE09-221]OUZ09732.1 hypothetical protein BHE97_09755 [Aeromicrobium sp. PE09-221]